MPDPVPHPLGPARGSRPALVWLRRDLRLADHPALHAALEAADEVLLLFVVDPRLVRGRFASPNRTWYLRESLRELGRAVEDRGGRLIVRAGTPTSVVPLVAADIGASEVFISREYTPFGRARDRAVASALARNGATLRARRGVLVHEPEEVLTRGGSGFRTFAAFRRQWGQVPLREVLPAPATLRSPAGAGALDEGPAAFAATGAESNPTCELDLVPRPGEASARGRLDRWTGGALDGYADARELPAVEGTSRLSADLHLGLLSANEVAAQVAAAGGAATGRDAGRFLDELAWRDFYANVLWHDPDAAGPSSRPARDGIPWRDDPEGLAAWQEGRTGYPIVDAGMRQLRRSGWLHNRVRMIVASFLTKDLLVDWRAGEAEFMHHLLDGDVASNNGGWQWVASTGLDAQPYFRVFNPTLQGERFDPDGGYVRRWIPELSSVPSRWIHLPWEMPAEVQEAAGCRIGVDYPGPIVDHAAARDRALEAFASARRTGATSLEPE